MSLEIVIPIGNKKTSVKNLVFTILSKEYPLKIIELTNFIKKRYGLSVTFQAVRKATLELVEDNVLIQVGKEFKINKEWVTQGKKIMDELYTEINKEKVVSTSIDSIEGEISVFHFDSLNKMMKFWQDIIQNWSDNLDTEDLKINCYQGAHIWEGLLHLDRERVMMGDLQKKGVKSYIYSVGDTKLDRNIIKFYDKLGLQSTIQPSKANFDKSFYIGTYGKTIVQCQYPKEVVEALDDFFSNNHTLDDLELERLSEIVNKEQEVKLTVIKNEAMAKQINKGIIDQF